jgi:MFS family permease
MYADYALFGIDYKILLIMFQVFGYAMSKFMGIKYVSELKSEKRIGMLFGLIGVSLLSLLLFGLFPYPAGFVFLFFNGLPIGMIWGIVFSFLEGRRNTELLGAGMCASFVVASGLVKTIGRSLVQFAGVSEFWMPFFTGLLFVPLLIVGGMMLRSLPAPDERDVASRNERTPMNRNERWQFFLTYAPGIVFIVLIYIALTIFRDLRDNYAIEILAGLGLADQPEIMTYTEIPIAIAVLVIISLMVFIKINRVAFYLNYVVFIVGATLIFGTTWLQQRGVLHPVVWIILSGFGMYLAYIAFHTFLLERLLAHFRHKGNIGFLMYVVDSFGYLASVVVLLYKNFSYANSSWLAFFQSTSYVMALGIALFSVLGWLYFLQKEKIRAVAVVKHSFNISTS